MKKKSLYLLFSTIMLTSVLVGCNSKKKEDTIDIKEKYPETHNVNEETKEEDIKEDNEEVIEEVNVIDNLLMNLGKTLPEVTLFEDEDKKIQGMKTDATTYWLFPQTYGEICLDNYDRNLDYSYAVFANGTNDWKSSNDFAISYYKISSSEIGYVFNGLETTDGYADANQLKAYFGEPVYSIGDSYVFEYNNDYYLSALYGQWDVYEYTLCKKEDISLYDTFLAGELGVENKVEESKVVEEGTTNYSIELPNNNGTIKIKMCDRIVTINNLTEDIEIETNRYVLTEDGTYIVNGFVVTDTNDYDLSVEMPMNHLFSDKIGPFYSKSLPEGKAGEMVEETNDYIIYKIDPNTTFSGTTSEYCIYMKSLDIYFTAYRLDYKDDQTECLAKCKEIINYINNNIEITKVE